MPRFSVIVPAYNNGQYLSACLDSVINQSYTDWELVVVVDGSPDNSAEIAKRYAAVDARIVPIIKPQNEGTHRARMSGVEACTGEYTFFLDADDEMIEDALAGFADVLQSRSADMIHCGIEVVDAGVNEGERLAFEAYINKPHEDLRGAEIIQAIYAASGGYRQDWRVTQRLYDSVFLKKAYAAMTRDRLGRAEDGYEFFVLAALAQSQITCNSVKGVRYFYGRGVSGSSALSGEQFKAAARDFQINIDAIKGFCDEHSERDLADAYLGANAKMLQLLWNDWHDRVPDADKVAAARLAAPIAGAEGTATEIMRLARDRAYSLLGKEPSAAYGVPSEWIACAESLIEGAQPDLRYKTFAHAARNHAAELEARRHLFSCTNEPIRIFVSAHKPVSLFDSRILQPVQVGCANTQARFPEMFHDDEGKNISAQNPMYCELTAQYWAWKNADAQYYGFCHYRRYFSFAQKRYTENVYGEIMAGAIDARAQERFGLSDAAITNTVQGFDVITTEVKDLTKFPGVEETPLEHYDAADKLHGEDLRHMFAIVKEEHPDYAPDVDAFANGNRSCFCNMFIMRKQIFFDYCAWLFPLLERFVTETDMSRYSQEALRTPGHLAERLLNVYLMHHERIGTNWKRKQVQCVHFTDPGKRFSELSPMPGAEQVGAPIIPVVFAADNNYVPMLTCTITSMLHNAAKDYRYDIVVLERGITPERKRIMEETLAPWPHASLRFFYADSLIADYKLTTSNAHISNETYYRFLIQDVLPYYDKVLYLDSDLIILDDVAKLYAVDLDGLLLAATHDIDFVGNVCMHDGERLAYSRDVLGMKDPFGYFQAGVLVLNTAEMRRLHSVSEWLQIATNPDYIYNDQDILNAECEGRVRYLAWEWNVMHNCSGRVADVFSYAPAPMVKAYEASRACPKIIHYAGGEKPWNTPQCDMGTVYWRFARPLPFYEELLSHLAGNTAWVAEGGPSVPAKALSEENPLRRVVDPLMPLGSRRREVAKSIGRAVRGRS